MPRLEKVDGNEAVKFGINSDKGSIFRQEYSTEPLPDGVVSIKLPVNGDEFGGHFLENARFEQGVIRVLKEKGVELNVIDGQSNTSIVAVGTERFGHLHREQDELWIVADGVLTVALYDIRVDSPTYEMRTRLVLSKGMGVRIPPGVVHGLANYTNEKAVLTYFISHQFSSGENSQEWRFVPDDGTFWDFAKPDKI